MGNKKTVYFIITVLAALFYLPFIGHFHLFDWDEINFAESAREMIVSGNYSRVQIGFEPFWEKPPLFIWMQVLCMKVFGINEFAARLPNALCGIVTLNLLYYLGVRIRNHFTAVFWVLAYATSLAPSIYFRSGIIDPVFNLFVFLSVFHLYRAETGNAEKLNIRVHMLIAGLFAGLAVLTKGPVAILILGLVYITRWIINPRYAWNGWLNMALAVLSCLIVTSLWVLPEWLKHGPWFFHEFVKYQLELFSGQINWHEQPWFYHILVLLFLCFPSSVLSITQLIRGTDYAGNEKIWSQYMRSLFWVVLILFSIVSTKIIHYSSLCWFPLSWFAGNAVYKWHTNRGKIQGWLKIPITIVVLVLSGVFIIGGLLFTKPSLILSWIPVDDKVFLSIIKNSPTWIGIEWVIGFLFFIAALVWVVTSKARKGTHPAWIFVITGLFSALLSTVVIPSAEGSLQSAYINELEKISKKDVYFDTWGFKSYAHFFYGKITPEDMKGPWSDNLSEYANFQNPNATSRQRWLMDKPVNKPVYIFTKIDFNPDVSFNNKFAPVKELGAYKLWKRIRVETPVPGLD